MKVARNSVSRTKGKNFVGYPCNLYRKRTIIVNVKIRKYEQKMKKHERLNKRK